MRCRLPAFILLSTVLALLASFICFDAAAFPGEPESLSLAANAGEQRDGDPLLDPRRAGTHRSRRV
jgi:hypothetical protein